jgi:hypothetical protein
MGASYACITPSNRVKILKVTSARRLFMAFPQIKKTSGEAICGIQATTSVPWETSQFCAQRHEISQSKITPKKIYEIKKLAIKSQLYRARTKFVTY